MILVNKNFGNPVLSEVIGDMFKGSSNTGMNTDHLNHNNTLASGSSLVTSLLNTYRLGSFLPAWDNATRLDSLVQMNNLFEKVQSFCLVTEHFLKTLDKVYTKIWNESFTETGIYTPSNLATMYNGFVSDITLQANSTLNNSYGSAPVNIMLFKKFVDRCITAGILLEEDRLDYKDQIFISDMSRSNMSTQVDTTNRVITLTHSTPIDISPDIDAQAGQYLNGKKLYLMMTPYLTNESVIKGSSVSYSWVDNNSYSFSITQEPFYNVMSLINTYATGGNGVTYDYHAPVRRPVAFFKPKTDASKFGRSLPLATHLIWSIGTPEDKALAEANNQTPPDLIFDHLDRISHIDSLVLKIKFDKLQF